MPADTRSRMIDAAVTALQRRGAAGMSFTEVLQASGAARGAIYHHFPGGKAQLLAEATERNGDDVRAALRGLAPAPSDRPGDVVAAFFAAVRPVVQAAAQGAGCAVAAVTVEADDAATPRLRAVAAAAFDAWTDELAAHLAAAGVAPDDARGLATTLVTLLEGAQVLCRAAGSLEPFDRVVRAAGRLTV